MAPTKMDGLEFASKHLMNTDSSDTVREMIRIFAEQLMSADVDWAEQTALEELAQSAV